MTTGADLRKYAQHLPECASRPTWRSIGPASVEMSWGLPCTCGLDALLAGTPPQQKDDDEADQSRVDERTDSPLPVTTAPTNEAVPSLAELVVEATTAAEAMRLVDFSERKQEFFCRVCRYKDPLHNGTKLHDDDCPYKAFVEAMGRLHAAATGVANFVSEDGR